VLFQRLAQAKKTRPNLKVVVIDPRKTATCEIADLHLMLKPGSDAFLFNGLFSWLYANGHEDEDFIKHATEGCAPALDLAQWYTPTVDSVAQHCELAPDDVERFFRWFGDTQKTVTVYSQGINQSSSGSDKVNAIINCHLLTGRIGRPGMGPFSVTGQPNAMGGREVGALANQLAAHMDYNQQDIERVGRFWRASNMSRKPGLKAVDLYEAVREGKIKALWIMATNPAVSMPQASRVHDALKQCEFLVVSDCVTETDTTRYAHVLLPALAWGEKSGSVTNSERRISRQRGFLEAPGEAMPDWWIVSQVAQRMGYQGFDYHGPAPIFREHARLSTFENEGTRDFDLGGLADIDDASYEVLEPVQWPVAESGQGSARLFQSGHFFTDNRRARFVVVTPEIPRSRTETRYPMLMNTGRIRDQWHTMTRTGKAPRLNMHLAEPFVSISPFDAQRLEIAEHDLLAVTSANGEVVVKAQVDDVQRQGEVFMPMHWSEHNSSACGVGQLIHAHTDPYSGQPEFKQTPVSLRRIRSRWSGFALSRRALDCKGLLYWSRSRRESVWLYELSGEQLHADWRGFATDLLPGDDDLEWGEFMDSGGDDYRLAKFSNGAIDSCLLMSSNPSRLPSRDWLCALFDLQKLERSDRLRVLAGTPGGDNSDQGETVCACFAVGKNRILQAIREQRLSDAAQIGELLQAGTNCGSCIPELNSLLRMVSAESLAHQAQDCAGGCSGSCQNAESA
jgi:assimilatory nitrate reductase catalytic subunit